jgi:undecaprenyl diphosphate synthase
VFKFFSKKSALNSLAKIPDHIAIIMDGNARYAKSKSLPIKVGHKIGSDNVQKIANNCIEIGVKYLTIYAFSSENWNRPKEEVDYLMSLLYEYLSKESQELIDSGVKIVVSGNLNSVEEKLKNKIRQVEELSKNNSKLTLSVAFSYGARQEIVDAVKKIAIAVKNQEIIIDDINEDLFKKHLYHPEIPDPDLLIRTAGDLRISNFLLWQIAYTEFYFSEKFWPEFDKFELIKAINNFNKRERRYGKR